MTGNIKSFAYRAGVRTLGAVGLKEPVYRLMRRAVGVQQVVVEKQLDPDVSALPISVAPHNIQLYRYFLQRYQKHGIRFVTYETVFGDGAGQDAACATLRHDVDFTPENLSLITDLEQELGIRSEIHVIVDGSFYDPTPWAEQWRALAADGFKFGLHTLAPSADDYFSKLRSEINQFKALLGFAPETFSIHGVCPSPPNWAAMRKRFLDRIKPRLSSFGFVGSHNYGGVTRWVEDSGAGGEFAYLKGDWVETIPKPGEVIGVLVHPDHWTAWPPRWTWDETKVTENPLLTEFIGEARGIGDDSPAG